MEVNETFIQTSIGAVQDGLYNSLYNISAMLGDEAGRVKRVNRQFIDKYLSVDSEGKTGISGSVTTPGDSLLGGASFVDTMSEYGKKMFPLIKSSTSEFAYVIDYDPNEDECRLFEPASKLSDDIKTMVSYLYVEAFSLLVATVNYREGDIFKFSMEELDTIFDNTEYLAIRVSQFGISDKAYELLYVVRRIQRAILFIKRGMSVILEWYK